MPKRYASADLIEMVKDDGWVLVRIKSKQEVKVYETVYSVYIYGWASLWCCVSRFAWLYFCRKGL
jgi:hypothetical protein